MYICGSCGNEVEKYANKKKCRACYNEYMRVYMLKRYYQRRTEAIEYLGEECIDCGTTEELELDHLEPWNKTYDIGKVWTYSIIKFWAEVEKCTLRCKECHKRTTSEWRSVDHGEGLTGKKNCRCDLCGPLKNVYMKNWKLKRAILEELQAQTK